VYAETRNNLAEGDDYARIQLKYPLEMAGLEMLQYVYNGLEQGQHRADCLDGVVVAIDHIDNVCRKLKYDKHIYLLTDGESEIRDEDQVGDIATKMLSTGIQFDMIAFDFDNADMSIQKVRTVQVLKTLALRMQADNVSGEVFQADEAYDLLSDFSRRTVSPTAVYKGNLTIGEGLQDALHFPVQMYGKVMAVKAPSASRVYESDQVHGKVNYDRKYVVKVPKSTDESSDVPMTQFATQHASGTQMDDVEIEPVQMQRAYPFGKTLVPFDGMDQDMLKYPCAKGLSILGFFEMRHAS
jgi:ATP-dependent DNA helicase 2 subunit 2